MKFWDKGFTLETKHWWWLYITKKMKFPMDLHNKAYHLNHWLLSLYGIKYLHYSVTLLSRGWNSFPGVCSHLDLELPQKCHGKSIIPIETRQPSHNFSNGTSEHLSPLLCHSFWWLCLVNLSVFLQK